MSDYTTPEKVADYLSHIDLAVIREEPGTIFSNHVRYQLVLTRYGKSFRTSFESNPEFHGKPDITQVFSTLLSDDMYMSESRNLAEYLDNEVANQVFLNLTDADHAKIAANIVVRFNRLEMIEEDERIAAEKRAASWGYGVSGLVQRTDYDS